MHTVSASDLETDKILKYYKELVFPVSLSTAHLIKYSDLFLFLTEKSRQPCPPTAWPVVHRRGTPAALEYALYSQYRAVNRWEQKCVLSRVVRKCV